MNLMTSKCTQAMNNLDIEIYKQIKPTKGLTEIYLGHVIFPWHYALADYSVDRTEGIPFDVFDKVICRLLELDGTMTIVQLGNILGMNIEAVSYTHLTLPTKA